jgi:CubicO group peptidase (beta-lactamase class C family)
MLSAAALYGSAHLLDGRYAWARAVAWGESDAGDQFRFPSRSIDAGGSVSPLLGGPPPPALDLPVNVGGVGRSYEQFLEATDTKAFLVVHHDRLVYERYLNGAEREDRQTSFSAAKSVLATLVGLAVDEGLIESVDDPVTDYVPELAERDGRFDRITLRHLLTMSSGISYQEQGLPWSDDALTYYGTDLRELALQHTEIAEPPGRTWNYDNYNPLLLGLVLERASGASVSEFMSTRLWRPLGAEADASWSLDSTGSGFEKMESGVNARPVDFARLGLLMLHQGHWNGQRILSRHWVREATSVDVDTDPADFYQYFWWVAPQSGEKRSPFFARGKYAQYIGVFPQQDLVIVRMGTSEGGVDWQAELLELAERIS